MRSFFAACLTLLIVLVSVLPASAQASTGHTAVMFVGGLNSKSVAQTSADFSLLMDALTNPQYGQGYDPNDVYAFSYDPNGADNYDPALTCRSIFTNAELLASSLRWLRDTQGYSNVALVGHSLGGMLSTFILTPHFEFVRQGFIRSVTTIDSPMLGLDSVSAFAGSFRETWRFGGQCTAIGELESLAGGTEQVRADWANIATEGVPVVSIANEADLAVPFWSQAGIGPAQHWTVRYTDGSFTSHGAALKWAKLMGNLANWIGPQGS